MIAPKKTFRSLSAMGVIIAVKRKGRERLNKMALPQSIAMQNIPKEVSAEHEKELMPAISL